jgi:hypothetical protein
MHAAFYAVNKKAEKIGIDANCVKISVLLFMFGQL